MPRKQSATYLSRLWAVALVALAVAWAWVLIDVRCAWADESGTTIPAKVKVFQEYKVSASGLQNTFEYLIVPQEENAPLPVDADGATFSSFKLTRNQELWLTFPVPVDVSPAAERITYHYVLKPAQTTLPSGLYYVDTQDPNLAAGVNVYYLDIDVMLSSTDAAHALVVPTVHLEDFDGPKITDPGWRIAYQKQSSGGSSSGNGSSGSNSSSTKTPSRATTVSRGTTSSGSNYTGRLAQTNDPFNPMLVRSLATGGAALLLLGLILWLGRRRGEGHA